MYTFTRAHYFLVSKLGYYMPWSLFGGVMTAIGGGLASTFRPNTNTGQWVGYQIIQGVGRGAGMQMVSYFLLFSQTPIVFFFFPRSISLLISRY